MVNTTQFIVFTIFASCYEKAGCSDIISALYSHKGTGDYQFHHRPSRSSVEAVVTPHLKASKSRHYFDSEVGSLNTAQSANHSSGERDTNSPVNEDYQNEAPALNYLFYSAKELTEAEKRRLSGPCGIETISGFRFKTYLATGIYVYALKSKTNKNRVTCYVQSRTYIYLADNSESICQL